MPRSRTWVAVIDDELDLAQLFSDALNSIGIKTKAFSDPVTAVDYLHKYHNYFRLVITDWKMPSMSGLELTKLVQQIDREIRILVMSAFELERDQLKEIQIDDYLRKPMHITQLIKAVNGQLVKPSLLTAE